MYIAEDPRLLSHAKVWPFDAIPCNCLRWCASSVALHIPLLPDEYLDFVVPGSSVLPPGNLVSRLPTRLSGLNYTFHTQLSPFDNQLSFVRAQH